MKAVFLSAALMASGIPASAGSVTGDQFCELLMPQMLQFVENTTKISGSFRTVYSDTFTSADRTRFAELKSSNDKLEQAAKDYRAAFIKACYDN
ncbi:hypothetical protein EOW65_15155 [Sinirhodobacter ferrireducens]|uniref:Uncharacterized protein n=1 Tax=Paenirhodobacter ferrireducens TaxID=1215032 RepID=A0A443L9S0_9RHOB|nr:hypothetical protein [Sinirhodobacter ferrireducens]RWR45880.1 hypothetical protein EOW65_15155 [Sinirhodobacter ferrireducens]